MYGLFLMCVSFLRLIIPQESIKQSSDNILLIFRQLLNVGYFFDQ